MTNQPQLPPEILERLASVTKKRPKAVIEHILKYGYVTTEELETVYGYRHPPRAARDVREEGIPLDTFRVKNSTGRTIGAYRFADLSLMRKDRIGGRIAFSKEFKQSVIETDSPRCAVCSTAYEARYLQVDHRIPYEVAGDLSTSDRKITDYMLLCASCNRTKSWSCEHCQNLLIEKKPEICATCYWAVPTDYKHIALRQSRRLDVVWDGNETDVYDRLKEQARALDETVPEFIKEILQDFADAKGDEIKNHKTEE